MTNFQTTSDDFNSVGWTTLSGFPKHLAPQSRALSLIFYEVATKSARNRWPLQRIARVRLVQDLEDAIGVEVDDDAVAVHRHGAVTRSIRDRPRTDIVGEQLTLNGVSAGDQDARAVADRP